MSEHGSGASNPRQRGVPSCAPASKLSLFLNFIINSTGVLLRRGGINSTSCSIITAAIYPPHFPPPVRCKPKSPSGPSISLLRSRKFKSVPTHLLRIYVRPLPVCKSAPRRSRTFVAFFLTMSEICHKPSRKPTENEPTIRKSSSVQPEDDGDPRGPC